MRKLSTLFVATLLTVASLTGQGQRFVDEVFTDVVKLPNQLYSINVTVVTGAPAADTLLFDLYLPAGDTCSSRPLAVVMPTGTFLPRGIFAPTGDKDDYANVKTCEGLARRGYVAASIQYRIGWNPVSPQDTVRRSTIINAAYRAVQDLHAFLRFVNMTIDDFGNPYRIDSDRIAIYGIGTGGFVGFNAAILTQEEIYIDKFTNPSGRPMVDTLLVGNLTGEKPGLINIPNHVGYKQDFHFAYGLDGAVGDSAWMVNGPKIPFAVVGTVTHPTTPFGIDPINGTINCDLPVYAGAGTGSFVVNIGGSICMIDKANKLGYNDPLKKWTFDDPVSEAIRTNPNTFGNEHIWAINLPGPQSGPWEYWDAAFWDQIQHPLAPPGVSIHDVALSTNPDMSIDKANRYIDTALQFFAPRAYAAMKLNEWVCSCNGVAQDPQVIQDFECQRNVNFGAGADHLMIIDNPDATAPNTSAKVGMYTDPANDPWAALCADFGGPIDLSSLNQFSVQMWSNTAGPLLVKLEGGSSPAYEVWTATSGSGEWETISVDFSSQASANHTRLCLFPNGGVGQGTEDVYFVDNLRLDMSSAVFTPTVEKLQVSPNPAGEMLYLRNTVGAAQVRLVNTLGQTVMTQKVTGQDIVSMFVSDLLSGIYVVGAYDASGKLLGNARILKN